MKRLEKDFFELLACSGINEDTLVCEGTVGEIMQHLGFVQKSSDSDLEAARSIWESLPREVDV